jgi:hypothetical protein
MLETSAGESSCAADRPARKKSEAATIAGAIFIK